MKTKISLWASLLMTFVFFACGDDSSSSAENAVKKVSEEERCADIYGYDLNEVAWIPFYDETSFIKKDILNKATSVTYSYARNMETRSIEYNENADNYKILVMDLANSPSAHNHFMSADIDGCTYRFYEDEELSSFLKEQPDFEINSCFCSEEEGKFYYLNVKKGSDEPKFSSSSDKRSSSSTRSSSSYAGDSNSEKSSSSEYCSDSCEVVDDSVLKNYDVAYEFSDTSFLGKDFVGGYDASVGEGFPQGDGSSLILDGSSGLYVPFADVFNADEFVIETKIYPTKFSKMQNIFVAEPPGSNVSGWILRLENGKLRFLIRGDSLSWQEIDLPEITLNTWTTIRVEKKGSELNSEMRILVNGKVVHSDDSYYPMTNMKYKLGIGYDAVNQDYHDRYFIGKIDYIRFKNDDQD